MTEVSVEQNVETEDEEKIEQQNDDNAEETQHDKKKGGKQKKTKGKKPDRSKSKKKHNEQPEQELTEAQRAKKEKEEELKRILAATENLEIKVAAPQPKVVKPMKFNNYYARKYGGKTQEELDQEEAVREAERQRELELEKKKQQEEEEQRRKQEEERQRMEEEKIKNARDSMIGTNRESTANRESVSGLQINGVKKDSYYMRKYIKQIQEAEEMERKRQQEIKEREIQERIRLEKEEAERKAEEDRLEQERLERLRLEEEAAARAKAEEEEKLRILEEEKARREKFDQQRDERNKSLFNQKTIYTPEQIAQITKEFTEKREQERQQEIERKKAEMEEIERKFQEMMERDKAQKEQKAQQTLNLQKQNNIMRQQQQVQYLKQRHDQINDKTVIQEMSQLQITIQQLDDIKTQARQILHSQNSIKMMSKYNVDDNNLLNNIQSQINLQKIELYQKVQEASVVQEMQQQVINTVDPNKLGQVKQQQIQKSTNMTNSLNMTAKPKYYEIIKTTPPDFQNKTKGQNNTEFKPLIQTTVLNHVEPVGTQRPVYVPEYQMIMDQNLNKTLFSTFKFYNLMSVYNSKTAETFCKENNLDPKYRISTFEKIKQQYSSEDKEQVKNSQINDQIPTMSDENYKQLQEAFEILKTSQRAIHSKEIDYLSITEAKKLEYGFQNHSVASLLSGIVVNETDDLFSVLNTYQTMIGNINKVEVHKGNDKNSDVVDKCNQLIKMFDQLLIRATETILPKVKRNTISGVHPILTQWELIKFGNAQQKSLLKQFLEDMQEIEFVIFKLKPTPQQLKDNNIPQFTGNTITYDYSLRSAAEICCLSNIDPNQDLIEMLTLCKQRLYEQQTIEGTNNNDTFEQYKAVSDFIDAFIKILILCKKYIMGIYTEPNPKNKNEMLVKHRKVDVKDEDVTISLTDLQCSYVVDYNKQFVAFLQKLKSIQLATTKPHAYSEDDIKKANGYLMYKIRVKSVCEITHLESIDNNENIFYSIDKAIINLDSILKQENAKGNIYNGSTIQDITSYLANLRETLTLLTRIHLRRDCQNDDDLFINKLQITKINNMQINNLFQNLMDSTKKIWVILFVNEKKEQELLKIQQQKRDELSLLQQQLISQQEAITSQQKDIVRRLEEIKNAERQRTAQLELLQMQDKKRQAEEQRKQREYQQLLKQQEIEERKRKLQEEKLQKQLQIQQQHERMLQEIEEKKQQKIREQKAKEEFETQQKQMEKERRMEAERRKQMLLAQASITSEDGKPENEIVTEATENQVIISTKPKKKVLKIVKKAKSRSKSKTHDTVQETDSEEEEKSGQQPEYQEEDQYAEFEKERQLEYQKQLDEQREWQRLQQKSQDDQANIQQVKEATPEANIQSSQIKQTESIEYNESAKPDEAESQSKPVTQPFVVQSHELVENENIEEKDHNQQQRRSSIEQNVLKTDIDDEPEQSGKRSSTPTRKKGKFVKHLKKTQKAEKITINPFEMVPTANDQNGNENFDLFG